MIATNAVFGLSFFHWCPGDCNVVLSLELLMKTHEIPEAWKKAMQDNPTSQFAVKAGAVAKQLLEKAEAEKLRELAEKRSKIGTRLGEIFRERVGAVSCGPCAAAIRSLDKMTVEQVREKEDEIVAEISARAEKNMPNWFKKLLVKVDQTLHMGVTEHLIREYLREACQGENDAHFRRDIPALSTQGDDGAAV